MKDVRIVTVKTAGEYDILIGKGLLERTGELSAKLKKPCSAVLVTDTNVDALYSGAVVSSLEKAGFSVEKFVLAAGEKSKNTENFVKLLEFFAKCGITRSDVVFALGGGVVGDITGFAAAAYLRGIDFIQIPTSLLAAVDSSVGGKTAVDLEAGKNLAGAFHQPIGVICDTETFSTLPEREKACGYAEIIKYGVVFDRDFYDYLCSGNTDITSIVEKCVCFKRDVVQRDEFDNGERKLLNFGHTAAHGIEKDSGYTVTHGEAVAVGMIIAARIAENTGLCENGVSDSIEKTVASYGLPCSYDITAQKLYEAALSDKKRESDSITLVLPEKIGKCVLKKVKVDELCGLFEGGL